ncbi:hypothetical protein [Pseudanabaena sp. UWO311]|nr:hypothetical protein [Pseudanabaena sp. UWO311]
MLKAIALSFHKPTIATSPHQPAIAPSFHKLTIATHLKSINDRLFPQTR